MKILAITLLAAIMATPCVAADKSSLGSQDKAGSSSDALYNQAEELEWYKENNMKDVDALYDKAAAAGSDKAFMARASTRLFMAPADSRKQLANELCPKMAAIAKKWQANDKADPDQIFHLARYYGLPWCKERDLKKVRKLLTESAEAGNVKSQYFMGRMLQDKDAKAAAAWYGKAAKAGFPQAIAHHGVCYLLGLDVKKDHEKGMELIKQALASKNPNALYDIAIWYLQGDYGLPADVDKAEKILKELVAMDYEQARLPLDDIQKLKSQQTK